MAIEVFLLDWSGRNDLLNIARQNDLQTKTALLKIGTNQNI